VFRLKAFTLFLSVQLLLAFGCSEHNRLDTDYSETTPAYVESIDQWHREREASLKAPDGWLTLAGLFWLEQGENSFGSDPGSMLAFPKGKIAAQAGTITLKGDTVTMRMANGVEAMLGKKPVQEALLYAPGIDTVPHLTHGFLTWFVIKRGDKYGIRLRDLQNDALVHFKGIKRYPVQAKWRIQAKFVAHPAPKRIPITNMVGQTSLLDSPGTLVFAIDGQQYRLDVLTHQDELFVVFADKTNGIETYGAGRYVYTALPDADDYTVLDFNKATNPPCDFVSYATCPLPPRQNFLSIMVEAGEKSYGEY
jgi:uncharacterized protein